MGRTKENPPLPLQKPILGQQCHFHIRTRAHSMKRSPPPPFHCLLCAHSLLNLANKRVNHFSLPLLIHSMVLLMSEQRQLPGFALPITVSRKQL